MPTSFIQTPPTEANKNYLTLQNPDAQDIALVNVPFNYATVISQFCNETIYSIYLPENTETRLSVKWVVRKFA